MDYYEQSIQWVLLLSGVIELRLSLLQNIIVCCFSTSSISYITQGCKVWFSSWLHSSCRVHLSAFYWKCNMLRHFHIVYLMTESDLFSLSLSIHRKKTIAFRRINSQPVSAVLWCKFIMQHNTYCTSRTVTIMLHVLYICALFLHSVQGIIYLTNVWIYQSEMILQHSGFFSCCMCLFADIHDSSVLW